MPYRFECHRAYFSPSLAISINLGPLKPIFVVAVTLNMSVACIKDLGVCTVYLIKMEKSKNLPSMETLIAPLLSVS